MLVQDYHFALLPRMIKEERPDARVAIFWHIPWPNPEAFGICPWQRELLDGLLGADLIGFHIQSHCNNFLETVDRTLESRIDWERFAVNRGEHRHAGAAVPHQRGISAEPARARAELRPCDRAALLRANWAWRPRTWASAWTASTTPRAFRSASAAIERFLEKYPAYRGKFTFVQIGAPSRTHIKRYHDLLGEVEAEAERINRRFQTGQWKPIVFLQAAPQPSRDPAVLPRRRRLPGHVAARRHEPGGQGIRGRARRMSTAC